VAGGDRKRRACGDWATEAWPSACMRTNRDMWSWAVVGRWQAGPTNLNFSLNFEINTNFEIQNKGLLDVHKYSNFA
jgi:hypothetical protein